MWGWNWNWGPRGPMRGTRGFGRRGLGLGGLFLLPALLFGGWIILAVFGGLFGAALMIIQAVISGLGAVASRIFAGIGSVGSVIIGIFIGLALFSGLKKKKESIKDETGTVDGVEAETRVVEPEQENVYRTRY